MNTQKQLTNWRLRETGVSTLGYLEGTNGKNVELKQYCIEPTQLFNLPFVSCIPEGDYFVKHHTSPTFGACLIINGVEGRTDVLIHAGNFYKNTEACVLPGTRFGWVDGDDRIDIKNSKAALDALIEFVPKDGCPFIVRKVDNFQSVFGGFK